MERTWSSCPPPEALVAFRAGDVGEGEREELEFHLEHCERCEATLALLAGSADSRISTRSPSFHPPAPLLAPGTRVGRYEIERVIGAGSTGIVYRATDTELRRAVALKLLRRTAYGSDRLLEESRVLAKLSHPNIVQIFDVGRYEGSLYLALEHMSQTLSEWITDERPPVSVRMRALEQAGRGLLAAHREGLVHRDVKPDNILLDRNATAKLTDFELSLVADERARSDERIVGTVAFMPPEQLRGEPVEARADVFAFCATAWFVLTGKLPHQPSDARSADRQSWLAAKLEQVPVWPPDCRAPTSVRRILRRGLAPDPTNRPASMQQVLAVFEPRRRWWPLTAGLGLAFLGVFSYDSVQTRQALASCTRTVAGPRATQPLEANLPSAATREAQRIAVELDEYARAWRSLQERTCRAWVEHRLELDAVGRIGNCLETAALAHSTVVELRRGSSAHSIWAAADALDALPRLSDCEALPAREPPESSGGLTVDKELVRATLLLEASDYDGAEDALRDLPAAQKLSPRLQGRIARVRGAIALHRADWSTAASALRHALELAIVGGDWPTVAKVAAELVVARARQDPAASPVEWVELATAVARRSDVSDQFELDALNNLAIYHRDRNELDRALEAIERAKALGSADPRTDLAPLFDTLATVLTEAGRHQQAVDAGRRSVELHRTHRGGSHPRVAVALVNLASALRALGDARSRRDALLEARTIFEEAYGAESREFAVTSFQLGNVAYRAGDYDEALQYAEEAMAVLAGAEPGAGLHLQGARVLVAAVKVALGDRLGAAEILRPLSEREVSGTSGRVLRAKASMAYCVVLCQLDRAAGIERFEAELERVRAERGNDHPDTLELQMRFAVCLERGPRALSLAQEALQLAVDELSPDHPTLGHARLTLGRTLVASGEDRSGLETLAPVLERPGEYSGIAKTAAAKALLGLKRPREALEMAVGATEASGSAPIASRADAAFTLARAHQANGAGTRGSEWAIRARDLYQQIRPEPPELAEVERWLDRASSGDESPW